MRYLDARIDLDKSCNYRCVYCQTRPQPGGEPTHFPVDNLLRLLPILRKYCWSVFLSCGGEPTLHPEFEKIMGEHVPQLLRGTDVFLVTNGFLLDKDARAAILKSGITRVQVSVDTIDSELYSRLCGVSLGTLDKVWGNIEALIRERGKKKYPQVFLTSVAMKSTIDGLPDVCNRVVGMGLDGHRIQNMIPYDTEGMTEEDLGRSAETRAVFERCKAILRKGGVYADLPLSFADKVKTMLKGALLVRNKTEHFAASAGKLLIASRRPSCRLGGKVIRVDANGNTAFCRRDGVPVENIFDAVEKGIGLDKLIKNIYVSMRRDGMRACINDPVPCPYLNI